MYAYKDIWRLGKECCWREGRDYSSDEKWDKEGLLQYYAGI